MFPIFRSRQQPTQLGERRNLERGAVCSQFENNHANRRRILTAGLALSANGWIEHNCCAGDAQGLANDASPADVLKYLYAGNDRFAKGEPLAKHRNIERVRAVAKEQKPFAAFLGCADSRVPIEIVFDQGFGDLFVTRIAGGVYDLSTGKIARVELPQLES